MIYLLWRISIVTQESPLPSHDVEIPLAGGHLTSVVRVGDTVRRRLGPWSQAVHSLLRHLETKGFRGAPQVRGVDEQGREILTFIEGQVATGSSLPDHVWTDDSLNTLARLLRAFHDATTDFA